MRPRRALRRKGRIRRRIHLLPHLFTLGNLFAGFFAVSAILAGQLDRAALAVGVGIAMDGADGAVARLVRSSSPMGVQLDSLADVVTFGIAPAMLAYAWGTATLVVGADDPAVHVHRLGWIAAFAFVAACALRLARFNVATQDGERPEPRPPLGAFVGMPTPTAAACVAVVVHLYKAPIADWRWAAVWVAVLFVLAALMVSRIPFPSPKRWLANPPSPHLLMLIVALLIAAVYYYSEVVLFGLLALYLAVVVLFNLRLRMRRREPAED